MDRFYLPTIKANLKLGVHLSEILDSFGLKAIPGIPLRPLGDALCIQWDGRLRLFTETRS